MKQLIKPLAGSVLTLALLAGTLLFVGTDTALAANTDEVQKGINQVGGNDDGNGAGAFTNIISSIINILLFIIGAVAVIMIIIGGIRYTTSNGDQAQVTSAKNTILYAIVGLVVAIMAFAIVNFVVSKL